MARERTVDEEAASLLSTTEEEDWNDDKNEKGQVEFFAPEELLESPEAQMPPPKSSWMTRSPPNLVELLKTILIGLVPSFIISYWRPPPPKRPRHTAYLDGLRGAAAWVVYNYHLAYVLEKTEKAGFGSGGHNWEVYKLPLVRVLYSGSFSVSLFFVISGFALSIMPILAMRERKRDPGSFMVKLASVIMRRPMRLYLPSYVSSFAVMVAIRFNYFVHLQRKQRLFEPLVSGWWNWRMWPDRLPTFWAQLCDWTTKTVDWNSQYNGVLWTIRLEFYSSLALYLTHAAVYPMPRRWRTFFSLALIVCFMLEGSWSMPLFWAGFIMADYTQLKADEQDVDLVSKPRGAYRSRILEKLRSFFHNEKILRLLDLLASAMPWLILLTALFLASEPEEQPDDTPGFTWVAAMTPDKYQRQTWRLWYGVGSVMLVFAVSRIPSLMRLLSSSLMSYAGRVSFSFYLVHGPILHGVGRIFYYYCWHLTGKGNDTSAFIGFCLGYAVTLAFTVWVADIFMRAIDEPVVNLGSRLQKRFFSEI